MVLTHAILGSLCYFLQLLKTKLQIRYRDGFVLSHRLVKFDKKFNRTCRGQLCLNFKSKCVHKIIIVFTFSVN